MDHHAPSLDEAREFADSKQAVGTVHLSTAGVRNACGAGATKCSRGPHAIRSALLLCCAKTDVRRLRGTFLVRVTDKAESRWLLYMVSRRRKKPHKRMHHHNTVLMKLSRPSRLNRKILRVFPHSTDVRGVRTPSTWKDPSYNCTQATCTCCFPRERAFILLRRSLLLVEPCTPSESRSTERLGRHERLSCSLDF